MEEKKIYKVLIIDDDKFLLDVYSVKFRGAGHTVEVAFGGAEALEKIEKSDDFDAIVMDIVMPNMDGFEFLEALRKKGFAKKSSLVVLTNQGEQKDVERVKEFDVDGYIVKASTVPSDVLAEVTRIIENSKKK